MKNILRNKLFIMLLFFVIILFYFTSFVKASDNRTYEFNDSTYGTMYYTVPNEAKTFILFKLDGRFGFAYSTSENLYCSVHYRWSNFKFYTDSTRSSIVTVKRAKFTEDNWNYNPVKQENGTYLLDFANANYFNASGDNDFGNFIASTVDIYKDNATGVFFQKPPQLVEEVEQEKVEEITQILVQETTKAEITEQIKKTIVGFLKYLVVLVVSLIAFWKGWQFLSTQLKKA